LRINKPEISGLVVLLIGVALLAFTFLNAYWFLKADITIVASQDLVAAFGQALAPLIATCIHIMYLGIMGWIGSLLTLRGIPLLTYQKPTVAQATPTPTPVTEAKPAKKEEKAKEKVEKPQPPEKPEAKLMPKEEPKKEKEPEKQPGITIEVRPPEEATVEAPKPTPEAKEQPPKQPQPQN
jgi:hypothetical protein